MNERFESPRTTATSSDMESLMNSIKNLIMGGKMVRADKFIRQHLNFIDAEMKLNLAVQRKSIKGTAVKVGGK